MAFNTPPHPIKSLLVVDPYEFHMYKFIFKLACSVLGIGNQQGLSDDLECDPFLNSARQRFTCNLYYRFGTFLAPVSVGIITGKHYAKNSVTKLNDRSNNGTCDPAKTRNCNETEEPSEN